MKFLDLFAGIGGFRLALESQGHECVGFCEKDKFALKSYKAIHDTSGEIEFNDIRKVTNEQFRQLRGRVDIITGGFPCQSFSKAGKREGFRDLTRGTLFFEIARATNEIQPSILLLENVKGLLNHEKGETFRVILETLDELGYDAEWEVLNSKHYGVAHNRERVYIIGYLRGKCRRKIFPIGRPVGTSNAQISILAHRDSFRRNTQVYDPSGVIETLDTATGGGRGAYTIDNSGIKIKEATKTGYAIAKAGDSINTEQPESKTRRGRVGRKLANTLMTLPYQAVVENSYRIRKLTPKECWRLQSFPDWAFEKARKVTSDNQLYKQAGNTVTINVVIEIIKLIDKAIIEGDLIIERSVV